MPASARQNSSNSFRVLLADDQTIFRAGVARVLEADGGMTILAQCGAPEDLLDMVASSRGNVLVLAQSLGADMDKLFATAHLTGTRIVLMTDTANKPPGPVLRRLDGLLTRQASAADLLACVRRVGNGERALQGSSGIADSIGASMRDALSTRELQIIGFVVQGCKNRKIAEEIGTSEQVVKNYLRIIYDKTGSSDRLELALFTLHHRPLAEAAARAADSVPPSMQ